MGTLRREETPELVGIKKVTDGTGGPATPPM
jgi:hypothetical protein